MTTSIISHRLFVAALTNASQSPPKSTVAEDEVESKGASRNGADKPSAKALAALAARPWVNWPFAGLLEESPAA